MEIKGLSKVMIEDKNTKLKITTPSTNSVNNKELIKNCMSGNREAWTKLFEEILPPLRVKMGFFVLNAGGCEADIDDVFADFRASLFKNNFENLKLFLESDKPLEAWFYNGLIFQFKSWFNKNNRRVKKHNELKQYFKETIALDLIMEKIPELLEKFIKTLSKSETEYMDLSFDKLLSDNDIANKTKLSINTIRSRKFLIKEKFKAFLEKTLVY